MTQRSQSAARVEGRLELRFTRRRARTELSHAYARAPLKIVRPFALDGGRQLVQILTLGPGMCAGDAYEIDVIVEEGARAVVVTQAASRLHTMPCGAFATQTVLLSVRAGGQLEYYPGLTIPFPDSEFSQSVTVVADGEARVGLLDCWAMGRIGRGEYLGFRRLSSRTDVSVGGVPTYSDTLHFDPREADLAGTGLLEGHKYLASGFWYGANLTEPAAVGRPGVLQAFGETAPGHVYLRALAKEAPAFGETIRDAVGQVYRSWGLDTVPVPTFAS
jgi:urease accessory protein